jgi:hypothetical protein
MFCRNKLNLAQFDNCFSAHISEFEEYLTEMSRRQPTVHNLKNFRRITSDLDEVLPIFIQNMLVWKKFAQIEEKA